MVRLFATEPQKNLSPDVVWRRAIWLLLAAALIFKGKILYVLLYTLILGYSLSRRLLHRGFNAIRCTRDLSVDHVFLGEEAEVVVNLENRSRIPLPWVLASDETTHNVSVVQQRRAVVSLGSRQKKSWTYRVVAKRRGIHPIGPIHLEAGDALGLGHVHGRVNIRSPLIVYPRIHRLEDLGLPSTLPFGEMHTVKRFFDDPAHTIGARQYQPGDPFKNIHWKVTARTGDLHVKEYQPTVAIDTMLFLNLNESDYEVHLFEHYSELAIEAAASIGYNLVHRRQSIGLVTNGAAPDEQSGHPAERSGSEAREALFVHPRKGGGGLMRILEVLATVQCKPGMDFTELLANTTPRLNWGATLILITPVDTPEFIRTLLNLRRAGFNVIVIIVGFDPLHPQYLHRPPAPGMTFYHVRSPSELEAVGAPR